VKRALGNSLMDMIPTFKVPGSLFEKSYGWVSGLALSCQNNVGRFIFDVLWWVFPPTVSQDKFLPVTAVCSKHCQALGGK
jgi:hypothetical protein